MKYCCKSVEWLLNSQYAEYVAGAIVGLFLVGAVYYIIFGSA